VPGWIGGVLWVGFFLSVWLVMLDAEHFFWIFFPDLLKVW